MTSDGSADSNGLIVRASDEVLEATSVVAREALDRIGEIVAVGDAFRAAGENGGEAPLPDEPRTGREDSAPLVMKNEADADLGVAFS